MIRISIRCALLAIAALSFASGALAQVTRITGVNADYAPWYAAQAGDGTWWTVGDWGSADALVRYSADGTRLAGGDASPARDVYAMPDGGAVLSLVPYATNRCELARHDSAGVLRWTYHARGRTCFVVTSDFAGNTWVYTQTVPISRYFARIDRNGALRLDSEVVQLPFEAVQTFVGDPLRAGIVVGGTRTNTAAIGSIREDVSLRWVWQLPGIEPGTVFRVTVAPDGSVTGAGRVQRETAFLLLDVSLGPAGEVRRFGVHADIAADQVLAQTAGGDGSNWVLTANAAGLKQLTRIGADGSSWSTPASTMVCDTDSPCTLRAAGAGEVWQAGAIDGTRRTSFLRRWAPDGRLVLDRSWPDTVQSLAAIAADGAAVLIARTGAAPQRFVTVPRDGAETALPVSRGQLQMPLRITSAMLDGEGGTYAGVAANGGPGASLLRIAADGTVRWRVGDDLGWYSTFGLATNGTRLCAGTVHGQQLANAASHIDCFRSVDGIQLTSTRLQGSMPSAMRVLADGRVIAWYTGDAVQGSGIYVAEIDAGGTIVRNVRVATGTIGAIRTDQVGNAELMGTSYLRASVEGQVLLGPVMTSELTNVHSLASGDGGSALVGGSRYVSDPLGRGQATVIDLLSDGRLGWFRRFEELGLATVRSFDAEAWVATTSREASGTTALEPTVVHAIYPQIGDSRWRRDELLPVDVESALEVDAATRSPLLVQGWSGRVRQLVLDGATGALRRESFVPHSGRGANVRFAAVLPDGSVRSAFWPVGGTDRAAYVATTPTSAASTGFVAAGQPGIAGAWYPAGAAGQGLVIDWIAASRTLFAPWFTYTAAAQRTNDPAQQRWYSLQGEVPVDATRAELAIYENTGGNFDAPPATTARRVGTASIEFPSCNEATLRYRFDAGVPVAGNGAIALSRLTPRSFACREAGGTIAAAQADAARGGFETRQSGAWFAPATSGQGVMLTVAPGDSVFGAWFTYDDAVRNDDPTRQSWVTLQAGLASATGGQVTVPLYRTAGGTFDGESTQPPATWQVGEATLTFLSCNRARLDYRFNDDEAAAPQRARTGSIALERLGGCAD